MLPGELAAVQARREDLGLGGADLDAAPDQPRVERVVVGLKRRYGLGLMRVTQRRSRSGNGGSTAIVSCSTASRSIGRSRSVLCVRAFAFTNHWSSWCWKSRSFANRRPGSKLVSR
jgi:hypothetical protein